MDLVCVVVNENEQDTYSRRQWSNRWRALRRAEERVQPSCTRPGQWVRWGLRRPCSRENRARRSRRPPARGALWWDIDPSSRRCNPKRHAGGPLRLWSVRWMTDATGVRFPVSLPWTGDWRTCVDGDSFIGLKARPEIMNWKWSLRPSLPALMERKTNHPTTKNSTQTIWSGKRWISRETTSKFSPSWKGPNFVFGLLSKVLYWICPLHDEGPICRVHVADLANCQTISKVPFRVAEVRVAFKEVTQKSLRRDLFPTRRSLIPKCQGSRRCHPSPRPVPCCCSESRDRAARAVAGVDARPGAVTRSLDPFLR